MVQLKTSKYSMKIDFVELSLLTINVALVIIYIVVITKDFLDKE